MKEALFCCWICWATRPRRFGKNRSQQFLPVLPASSAQTLNLAYFLLDQSTEKYTYSNARGCKFKKNIFINIIVIEILNFSGDIVGKTRVHRGEVKYLQVYGDDKLLSGDPRSFNLLRF